MGRGRPKRSAVYEAFDQSRSDLSAVGGLPLPWEAKAIWRDIWHAETHHSTAIEGNTLAMRQVKLLLDEGRAVGNKELREYLEIQGYGEAAQWVYSQAIRNAYLEKDRPLLTLTELREIHRIAVGPAWEHSPPKPMLPGEGAGSFRLSELQELRTGLRPPLAVEVHPLVTTWLEIVNAGPDEG